MSKEDGGAALPRPLSELGEEVSGEQDGMTLRDYFAAAALQGLIACPTVTARADNHRPQIAEWSFSYADAMLEARKQ